MTTLIALRTSDALVMGCDSLGSYLRPMLDPTKLAPFFDLDDEDYGLLRDSDGQPLLKSFADLWIHAVGIPFNHMSHVEKIFDLQLVPMAVMLTGSVNIGNRSLQSLILDFIHANLGSQHGRADELTVEEVAENLFSFLGRYYRAEYDEAMYSPPLEMLLGGFDRVVPSPQLFRLDLKEQRLSAEEGLGLSFGGQTLEIERMIFGFDSLERSRLELRYRQLLESYRDSILKDDPHLELPSTDRFIKRHPFIPTSGFGWHFEGLSSNWKDFSSQNAIDYVDFLLETMIKSHRFRDKMPTVGGEVHVALITRYRVRFISKEEYRHGSHAVPKDA